MIFRLLHHVWWLDFRDILWDFRLLNCLQLIVLLLSLHNYFIWQVQGLVVPRSPGNILFLLSLCH